MRHLCCLFYQHFTNNAHLLNYAINRD